MLRKGAVEGRREMLRRDAAGERYTKGPLQFSSRGLSVVVVWSVMALIWDRCWLAANRQVAWI
jgi:hypothetical protein